MNTIELRNIIYKKAHGNSNISQKYYQLFYFERILERISLSKYNGQIILKGGLLLTSIIGNDDRTTKDMDATLKGIPLKKDDVEKVFKEILNININDGISFEITSIKDIRLEDEYGGYRLTILSKLDNNRTYVTIELTTGDAITPKEMKYNYNCIFEDKKIQIMSYTIETIIAEKFHTIVTRGLLNTRLKDFYDIYTLINIKIDNINKNDLINAIKNTFKRRETELNLKKIDKIINELQKDGNLKNLWNNYVIENNYAQKIKFEDTIDALKKVVEIIKNDLIEV